MADYTVTGVRKEWAGTGEDRHQHIEGVCTTADVHYTRKEVVDSIDAGFTWQTLGGRKYADIHKLTFCPHSGCLATPYIRSAPDATKEDNLDNLPAC